MTLLKFKGNPEHRVPRPDSYFIRQRPQYLGLEYREDGELIPAEFTVDDSTASGQRFLSRVRRDGSFSPVDEAAAAAIGVELKSQQKGKVVTSNG